VPSKLRSIKFQHIAIFAAGLLIGFGASPLWRAGIRTAMQDRFAHLTYLCDAAMREQLIAKQELALRPSSSNVETLRAAEIALIDCQDYDMLRKHLISWGLTENDLSLMGLKAIEARVDTLQKVIKIHEIRY
jgi:hypothetical protein